MMILFNVQDSDAFIYIMHFENVDNDLTHKGQKKKLKKKKYFLFLLLWTPVV